MAQRLGNISQKGRYNNNLMMLAFQGKWNRVGIAHVIMVLRKINFKQGHYYLKAFQLSAKEDI